MNFQLSMPLSILIAFVSELKTSILSNALCLKVERRQFL